MATHFGDFCMRPHPARIFVTALLVAAIAVPAAAQGRVSRGLAATLPWFTSAAPQATISLEVGPLRFPLRFRADVHVVEPRNGEPATILGGGSLLVPFLNRPLTPYLIGGAAFGLNEALGLGASRTDGVRVGGGLRYRLDERVLYLEASRFYANTVGGPRLTFGVQF